MAGYFEREVKALEKFIVQRAELASVPTFGDDDFLEILQFKAYAQRRFGLDVEDVQAMFMSGVVVDKDRDRLRTYFDEIIQQGILLAERGEE